MALVRVGVVAGARHGQEHDVLVVLVQTRPASEDEDAGVGHGHVGQPVEGLDLRIGRKVAPHMRIHEAPGGQAPAVEAVEEGAISTVHVVEEAGPEGPQFVRAVAHVRDVASGSHEPCRPLEQFGRLHIAVRHGPCVRERGPFAVQESKLDAGTPRPLDDARTVVENHARVSSSLVPVPAGQQSFPNVRLEPTEQFAQHGQVFEAERGGPRSLVHMGADVVAHAVLGLGLLQRVQTPGEVGFDRLPLLRP